MQNVHKCFKERFDTPLTGVDAHGDRAENTSDPNSVSGFDCVDQFIVNAHRDGVGRLSIGDSIRSLLQANDLLVKEGTSIVNERHGSLRAADISRAYVGLVDFALDQVGKDSVLTDRAAEER